MHKLNYSILTFLFHIVLFVGSSGNMHLAEERGQVIDGTSGDIDEEDRYSSVLDIKRQNINVTVQPESLAKEANKIQVDDKGKEQKSVEKMKLSDELAPPEESPDDSKRAMKSNADQVKNANDKVESTPIASKSKLNPNAKEFKLNANAAAFTPGVKKLTTAPPAPQQFQHYQHPHQQQPQMVHAYAMGSDYNANLNSMYISPGAGMQQPNMMNNVAILTPPNAHFYPGQAPVFAGPMPGPYVTSSMPRPNVMTNYQQQQQQH